MQESAILCTAGRFLFIKNEVMAVTHPRSVQKVHMNGRGLNDHMVKTVLCYLSAYFMILVLSILLLSLNGKDLTTNLTAVMATFNNVGPGLDGVGPKKNFGGFSGFSKFVLMFDMLAGRLEIFPVLVLLEPGLWKIRKKRN